jgi:hypothetical protein
MLARRTKMFATYAIAAFIAAGMSTLAFAQEDDEQAAEEEEVIEEIIVYAGGRPDDPVDVDALYEDMMRDMLMTDARRLRVLEEDQDWRNSEDTGTATTGRIKWGYSPQEDLRFGSESEMSDVQWITTKPATVFRFEF